MILSFKIINDIKPKISRRISPIFPVYSIIFKFISYPNTPPKILLLKINEKKIEFHIMSSIMKIDRFNILSTPLLNVNDKPIIKSKDGMSSAAIPNPLRIK